MEQSGPQLTVKEYRNFLRTVSHDLSAPIRHVEFFFNEIIESLAEDIDHETQTNIEFFRSSLEILQKKKKALLEMSRVASDVQNCRHIESVEIVGNIVAGLWDTHGEDCPKITYNDLPAIWGDFKQLSLVFEALIENAVLYHDGSVEQEIMISAHRDETHHIFSIEDNGIGIEYEFHACIFDIFRRLHGENEYGGGIGAGLTIAKSVIENHGGEIYVDVAHKTGCKMVFTVPI